MNSKGPDSASSSRGMEKGERSLGHFPPQEEGLTDCARGVRLEKEAEKGGKFWKKTPASRAQGHRI